MGLRSPLDLSSLCPVFGLTGETLKSTAARRKNHARLTCSSTFFGVEQVFWTFFLPGVLVESRDSEVFRSLDGHLCFSVMLGCCSVVFFFLVSLVGVEFGRRRSSTTGDSANFFRVAGDSSSSSPSGCSNTVPMLEFLRHGLHCRTSGWLWGRKDIVVSLQT